MAGSRHVERGSSPNEEEQRTYGNSPVMLTPYYTKWALRERQKRVKRREKEELVITLLSQV
jgi:hypothetical protein